MNLPNPFTSLSKDENSLVFITILLTDAYLQSALVEISQGKLNIIEKSGLKKYKDAKDGVVQADKSLQDLGPYSENVAQVVFGFDPRWIGSNGLIEEKKPFLKKITESLSLEPIGYVLLTEAFIQNLLSESPLTSAVCLYLQSGELYLYLLKQGKIVDKVMVGRSGDIIADVSEGLARLSKVVQTENQYFPAKIMIVSSEFDKSVFKDDQQKIIAHDWSSTFPFLQAPVVETIPSDSLITAVINQGGNAVASSKGITLQQKNNNRDLTPETSSGENIDFGYSEVDPSLLNSDSLSAIESNEELKISSEYDSFNTFNSKDHENNLSSQPNFANKEMIINDSLTVEKSEPEHATSFGVPIGSNKLPELRERNNSENVKTADLNSAQVLSKKTSLKSLTHKKIIFLGILIGLFFLAIMAFVSLFFISTAQLDIKLKKITVAKDVKITLDPQASASDPKNLILSANLVDKELSDSDEYKTTGIKLVGEKATGKITIFNKTDSVKTFEAGTVLTLDNQKFTLNEEVKVASSTVELKSTGETKNYGQVETQITATEIGADGNIGKDSELKIASFDSNTYSAKTNEEFTGGSSREIRVVAEKDRVSLLNDLTKTLSEKANSEFAQESGNGKYLVPIGQVKQKSVNFSAEVGDEVEDIKLSLTIVSQAIAYSSDDLKPLAKEVLTDDLPENYELLDQNPEILTSPSESATESSKTILDANVSAKAQPKINVDDIKSQIMGKSILQAKSDLESKDEIESVSFKIWPGISEIILKQLPKNIEKIQIQLN